MLLEMKPLLCMVDLERSLKCTQGHLSQIIKKTPEIGWIKPRRDKLYYLKKRKGQS